MATTAVARGTVDIAHFAAEEQQLGEIAMQWRGMRPDTPAAATLVQQYQQIAGDMHQRGWDGDWLSADDMLPDDLMPGFLKGS